MTVVTIDELEAQISELMARALQGEEIVISEDGKHVLKISPVKSESKKNRVPGIDKGKFIIPPEFDDPIPEFDL